jgi:hypothetical protein
MPISLLLAGLWVMVAWRTNGAPARIQMPASWALIVTGIPLLGIVTMELGPVAGLGGLALGVLLIRRPPQERPATGER